MVKIVTLDFIFSVELFFLGKGQGGSRGKGTDYGLDDPTQFKIAERM